MADMLPRLFFVHFRPTSFAAEAEGRVVAFLAGFRSQTDAAQAYVHFIGADPAWRGIGCRSRALRAILRRGSGAGELGCSEVHGVTSPMNRGSIRFHASMGFEVLPGDAEANGIPYVTDYDGPGESRVRLRRAL